VQHGDGLVQIARSVLKDENRWREIYNLNRDQMKSPEDLRPGMTLKLPGEKATADKKKTATSKKATADKPSSKPASKPKPKPRR